MGTHRRNQCIVYVCFGCNWKQAANSNRLEHSAILGFLIDSFGFFPFAPGPTRLSEQKCDGSRNHAGFKMLTGTAKHYHDTNATKFLFGRQMTNRCSRRVIRLKCGSTRKYGSKCACCDHILWTKSRRLESRWDSNGKLFGFIHVVRVETLPNQEIN